MSNDKKDKNKNCDLFDIDDKSLEKWVKDKLYPIIKKLAERGITPDLK